jgi:hypothetical protein
MKEEENSITGLLESPYQLVPLSPATNNMRSNPPSKILIPKRPPVMTSSQAKSIKNLPLLV